jgi:hypothetical protein
MGSLGQVTGVPGFWQVKVSPGLGTHHMVGRLVASRLSWFTVVEVLGWPLSPHDVHALPLVA